MEEVKNIPDKIYNVFTKNNCYLSTSVISPKETQPIEIDTIVIKYDSAPSHHYWRNQDKKSPLRTYEIFLDHRYYYRMEIISR